MDKQVVTKHNKLINAGYRLTLNETRVILYGISLIDSCSKEFPLEYQIDIQKFIKLFGLESNKDIYAQIKDAVMNKFWEREFTIDTDSGEKHRFRWLTRINYADERGYIKIHINPELKPWLHQLNGYFTSYHLDKISSFQSAYSVRLYEIILMHLNAKKKNKCSFRVVISHLKEQLDITEKYKLFADFNKRVLEPAKKEINKHSDIHISYKAIKMSRRYHEINFSVIRKTENPKQIENKSKPCLSPPIIEKAKCIIRDARATWDIKEIIKQFFEFSNKKGNTEDIERAFIGFVKHKIKKAA